MKVVINTRHGGFGLSEEAVLLYASKKGMEIYVDKKQFITHYYTIPVERYYEIQEKDRKKGNYSESNTYYFKDYKFNRNDPDLVSVVEILGEKANGAFAELKVIEIPDDVQYTIEESDGREWIAEKHRIWE